MNTLYITTSISFLIGLSASIAMLLMFRPRLKARGYALGYDAAYSSMKRSLDECTARIKTLHNELSQLQHIREIEKRGQQTSLEAVMQDCDSRIAVYARRASAVNEQDLNNLQVISKQLELAATTYTNLGATDAARCTRQALQHTINLTERLRLALDGDDERGTQEAAA